MAFFPLKTLQFSNFDLTRSSTFKSGMVLMRSAQGEVVKADRSLGAYDNLSEQLSKFIGFASIDHDTNNTIIISDSVGSSYVDIDGEYYENINTHYSSIKRSIQELSDESINKYYNLSDTSSSSPRGVGIFNISGETYITDQFNNVLAYTLFADSSTSITLSPGDLLTFGAGVNSGKLVKIDTSGFGPNVVVIGIVEKHDTASNLLYFRHHLSTFKNTPSEYPTGLVMSLDANNLSSYDAGVGGTIWYDLSGNNNNAYLNNGTAWNSAGYFVLDNSDDNIEILDANTLDFAGDFTVECFYKAYGSDLHMIIGKRHPFVGGIGVWAFASFFGLFGVQTAFWTSAGGGGVGLDSGTTYVTENVWYHFVVTRISNVKYLYINGVLVNSGADSYDYTNPYSIYIGRWDGGVISNPGYVIAARIYQNVGLTSDQVRQNFHNLVGRVI
jgi:hypothetical protein